MSTNMAIPEEVLDWQFDGKDGNLRAQNSYSTANVGNGYSMLNRTINEYATYQKQKLGINIGYKKVVEYKTHFHLPDGTEREILTGEKVAVGIGGGEAMLRWCHRDFGINLCWSATDPEFQWRIYDATGEKGKPIPTNSWVALFNVNVEPDPNFLIYFDRLPGHWKGGWPDSTDYRKEIKEWVSAEGRKALIAYLSS